MGPKSLTKDFKEFLRCLNARGVEYLVIGGHAVAFHGYPRETADLDVWVAVNSKNASLIVAALKDFGFDVPELSPDLFLREDRVIRMGVEPDRNSNRHRWREFFWVLCGACGNHARWRSRLLHFPCKSQDQQASQRAKQRPRGP